MLTFQAIYLIFSARVFFTTARVQQSCRFYVNGKNRKKSFSHMHRINQVSGAVWAVWVVLVALLIRQQVEKKTNN